VQYKLREELGRVLGLSDDDDYETEVVADEIRAVTYDDIVDAAKTPYLEAVVSEILRCGRVAVAASRDGAFSKLSEHKLLPCSLPVFLIVANFIGRVALEDINIQGHRVPKGETMLFLLSSAGYHNEADLAGPGGQPKPPASDDSGSGTGGVEAGMKKATGRKLGYWGADAEEFRPERWLDEVVGEGEGEGENGKRYKFDKLKGPSFPFSLGQRACFGQRLAVSPSRSLSYLSLVREDILTTSPSSPFYSHSLWHIHNIKNSHMYSTGRRNEDIYSYIFFDFLP